MNTIVRMRTGGQWIEHPSIPDTYIFLDVNGNKVYESRDLYIYGDLGYGVNLPVKTGENDDNKILVISYNGSHRTINNASIDNILMYGDGFMILPTVSDTGMTLTRWDQMTNTLTDLVLADYIRRLLPDVPLFEAVNQSVHYIIIPGVNTPTEVAPTYSEAISQSPLEAELLEDMSANIYTRVDGERVLLKNIK